MVSKKLIVTFTLEPIRQCLPITDLLTLHLSPIWEPSPSIQWGPIWNNPQSVIDNHNAQEKCTHRGRTVVFDPSSADWWTMLWWAEKEYPERWFASPITCKSLNKCRAPNVNWEKYYRRNPCVEHIYEKTTYISIYVHEGLNAIQADAILTFIRYINTAFMGVPAIQTWFINLMKAWQRCVGENLRQNHLVVLHIILSISIFFYSFFIRQDIWSLILDGKNTHKKYQNGNKISGIVSVNLIWKDLIQLTSCVRTRYGSTSCLMLRKVGFWSKTSCRTDL